MYETRAKVWVKVERKNRGKNDDKTSRLLKKKRKRLHQVTVLSRSGSQLMKRDLRVNWGLLTYVEKPTNLSRSKASQKDLMRCGGGKMHGPGNPVIAGLLHEWKRELDGIRQILKTKWISLGEKVGRKRVISRLSALTLNPISPPSPPTTIACISFCRMRSVPPHPPNPRIFLPHYRSPFHQLPISRRRIPQPNLEIVQCDPEWKRSKSNPFIFYSQDILGHFAFIWCCAGTILAD